VREARRVRGRKGARAQRREGAKAQKTQVYKHPTGTALLTFVFFFLSSLFFSGEYRSTFLNHLMSRVMTSGLEGKE